MGFKIKMGWRVRGWAGVGVESCVVQAGLVYVWKRVRLGWRTGCWGGVG